MTVDPEDTARTLLRRFAREGSAPPARAVAMRRAVLEQIPGLAADFGASRVFLFGSLTWGGAHERSDVDLAVEGLCANRVDAFAAAVLDLLGAPVDVVRLEAASESFRRRIEGAGELVYRQPPGEPA